DQAHYKHLIEERRTWLLWLDAAVANKEDVIRAPNPEDARLMIMLGKADAFRHLVLTRSPPTERLHNYLLEAAMHRAEPIIALILGSKHFVPNQALLDNLGEPGTGMIKLASGAHVADP